MASKRVCPVCKRPAEARPENKAAPFCSTRCQYGDLGNWLDEQYRVPTMITERTLGEFVVEDAPREH